MTALKRATKRRADMGEHDTRNTVGEEQAVEQASQQSSEPSQDIEGETQTGSDTIAGGKVVDLLGDKVRGLQREIDQLQSAIHEEQMLRIREQATLQRDKSSYEARVRSSLFLDLLCIVDSLGELVKHGEKAQEDSSLLTGSQAILAQMIQLLTRNGVRKLEGIEGKLYDSATSEIARVVAETDATANTVMRVLRDGYMMDDKLLRPAMVEVASATPAEKTDEGIDEN